MLIKWVTELFEILDDPNVNGDTVAVYLRSIYSAAQTSVKRLHSEKGYTDVISITIPGTDKNAPTTGIIGQLGALGARPEIIGFVSDGDGALCALTVAAKLLSMKAKGDNLTGRVTIATSICPNAGTTPHEPVPFIDPPVSIYEINKEQVTSEMSVIFSVDATKGNKITNARGFAISPVVKSGYILPPSDSLLELMSTTTGGLPRVVPLSQYDITPYESGFRHINSIISPNIFTDAPVVGVALTAQSVVAGSAPCANHFTDIEEAARFLLEAAKMSGNRKLSLYDEIMYQHAVNAYGNLNHFQKMPHVIK